MTNQAIIKSRHKCDFLQVNFRGSRSIDGRLADPFREARGFVGRSNPRPPSHPPSRLQLVESGTPNDETPPKTARTDLT